MNAETPDRRAVDLVEGFRQLSATFYGVAPGPLSVLWLGAEGETEVRSRLAAPPLSRPEAGPPRLVVVPPGHRAAGRLRLMLRPLEPEAVQNLSILVFRPRAVRRARKLLAAKLGRAPEIYGLDPDYYFSIVPLSGRFSGVAQRHVLDLKQRASRGAKIKHAVKRALIRCGVHGPLYPAFLLVARPPAR